MDNAKFLTAVQDFVANSFSVSVVRRMGPSGTLASVRKFLKEQVNLTVIGKSDPAKFQYTLDDLTTRLRRRLPRDAGHWGVARKCLNLFFRDALYNFYLRGAYGLEIFESQLEIPLDSYVGRRLRHDDASLPRWRTVKGLTAEDSARFQEAASQIAKRKGTFRVHLDVEYWRGEFS